MLFLASCAIFINCFFSCQQRMVYIQLYPTEAKHSNPSGKNPIHSRVICKPLTPYRNRAIKDYSISLTSLNFQRFILGWRMSQYLERESVSKLLTGTGFKTFIYFSLTVVETRLRSQSQIIFILHEFYLLQLCKFLNQSHNTHFEERVVAEDLSMVVSCHNWHICIKYTLLRNHWKGM